MNNNYTGIDYGHGKTNIDKLAENWETDIHNFVYERDGYCILGCLDNDLLVTRSLYYTYAQFCSPCVPGAGNLDNAWEPGAQGSADEITILATASGWPRVYCLGHSWFDGNKAPYSVFCVADNTLCEPPTQ